MTAKPSQHWAPVSARIETETKPYEVLKELICGGGKGCEFDSHSGDNLLISDNKMKDLKRLPST